jgi:3',5'-cyclic-AMP phosphodiesterase
MRQGSVSVHTLNPRQADVVELVQITDCHLFKDDAGKLLGLQTAFSLNAVLDDIATLPAQDLLLATGDLSQDGTPESYQRLRDGVNRFPMPAFWIPGNHDEPALMATELVGGNWSSAKRVLAGNWQIILLDSMVPRRVYGKLKNEQLALVEQALKEYPTHHALVVLHHHPVPVDCFWLDTIGLNNPEPLLDLLRAHKANTVVLWGHIHQAFDREQDGIRLLATPSTCVQFKPHSEDFQADSESPGYRLLRLHADGQIDTEVRRIDHMEFTVDYSVKGY